ncbi:hypothetical protein SODALDRAFT_357145 [Sodiomyces alkalinus F11]|uniref:Uncharacterized protein n=1 Tax=Sodiomyces alkalinus (strain CBS 110278 / VKM F-3762 / F11) TaxID=1314773 RepID=A0A3N2Q2Z5_SODAK|nr:hypothetical protein SODALDRAFT_357145 [Sodiomyces alkalinus F11]ROT41120.1 hypothetical protein SODALDRAFT_357145 [Sodiomyces alkalinus F11]
MPYMFVQILNRHAPKVIEQPALSDLDKNGTGLSLNLMFGLELERQMDAKREEGLLRAWKIQYNWYDQPRAVISPATDTSYRNLSSESVLVPALDHKDTGPPFASRERSGICASLHPPDYSAAVRSCSGGPAPAFVHMGVEFAGQPLTLPVTVIFQPWLVDQVEHNNMSPTGVGPLLESSLVLASLLRRTVVAHGQLAFSQFSTVIGSGSLLFALVTTWSAPPFPGHDNTDTCADALTILQLHPIHPTTDGLSHSGPKAMFMGDEEHDQGPRVLQRNIIHNLALDAIR